jgi:hypothetical protein
LIGCIIKKKEAAEAVDAVEEIMENEPKTSFRHLSQQVNFSVGTCRTILKKDLYLCPYRMTSVPELSVIRGKGFSCVNGF